MNKNAVNQNDNSPAESEPNKVMVIGLDGATFDLIFPLIEQDRLPNLKKLLLEGAYGDLVSTIPPITPTAWASFITGKNPGQHGVFDFKEDIFDSDRSEIVNANSIHANTLWDILSTHNKKIGIVNTPMTYPPKEVNGFMITGMLTPPSSSNYTYPDNLKDFLTNYSIDLDYGNNKFGYFSESDFKSHELLLEDLFIILKNRVRNCLNLIKKFELDFFMIVFSETDRLHHFFWQFIDPRCKAYAEEKASSIRERFYQFYDALDEGIGNLVSAFGKESTIIIMSDHGFGPAPTQEVHFNLWLKKLGLLKLNTAGMGIFNPKLLLLKMGLNREIMLSLFSKLLSRRSKNEIGKILHMGPKLSVDWRFTKAYFYPLYSFTGGIKINAEPRGSNGFVNSGKEYEDLRDFLIKSLRELEDPRNNKRIISQVYKREDLYSGEKIDRIPDIIVVLDPDYIGNRGLGSSELVGPYVRAQSYRDFGNHQRDGILIMKGKGIKKNFVLPKMDIKDLTPTILYLLGVPVLADMDGKVIADAFYREVFGKRPVEKVDIPYSPGESKIANQSKWGSDTEMKEIRKRLQGIGYM